MTKKEKIRDRFLQAFREGTDFRPILEEYQGSKSVLYAGMAMAFGPSLQEYDELRDEAVSLRKEVRDLEDKKKALQKETKNYDILQKKVKRMEKRIAARQKDLNDLKNKWDMLVKKGITPKIIGRIVDLEFQTGEQLLEQIESLADIYKLSEKCRQLNDLLNRLKTKFNDLQNRYDDTCIKYNKIKAAIKMVMSFIEAGFSEEHFRILLEGLSSLGITNELEQSVTRLLKSIDFHKKLMDLKEELETQRLEKDQLRAEIRTLRKKRAVVEAELKTVREKVTKPMIEAIKFETQESSQIFHEFLEAKKKDVNELINMIIAGSLQTSELRLARLLSLGQLASQEDIRSISLKEIRNIV
jgi:uncharacterized protein YlxW (UPF0749 family)